MRIYAFLSTIIVGTVFFLIGPLFSVAISAQGQSPTNENINYSEDGKKTISYRDIRCDNGCEACDNPFAQHCGDLVSRVRIFTIYIEEDDAENANNAGKEVFEIKLADYVGLDRTCTHQYNDSYEWINYDYSKKDRTITATLTGTTGNDQSDANTTKNLLVGGKQEKEFVLQKWNCNDGRDNVTIKIKSFLYNHYEEVKKEASGKKPRFNAECQNIAMEEFQKGVVLYASNCVEKTGGEFIKNISIVKVPKNTFLFGNDPNSNMTLQTIGSNYIEEITERVTEGGIGNKKINTTMDITYCTGKIESINHTNCKASETITKNIAFTIENNYDEPKARACNPGPMCGGPGAVATVTGASCFTGTGLTITPETATLSIGRSEPEFSREFTAYNEHPLDGRKDATQTATLRNLRDPQGNCNTTQTPDRDIVIDITTTEGTIKLSDNEIYNSGYRVESVTFTASANIQNPDWKHWYLAKSQTCTKSEYTSWGSGIKGNIVTLDEKGDNGYYICFGARRGTEEPVYNGIKYKLKIGPRVGNDITLAPGAPSAPGLFLSGTTEPGATVEVVSVTSNRVGILQGDTNPTAVADADGNWSLRIVNAIFPKVKNNITVKIKTDDGFRDPLEHTLITTVGEDGVITKTTVTPEDGSTPPGNRQRPGDIHATTEETASGAPSLFLPPALQRPAPTPPPFTITAEPTAITEGEKITWTITRTEDATEQNAIVSCREKGAWGAKPLTKDDITIATANETESFTMETEDDEVLEKAGTITCFVGAKSNPAVASKSFFVRVKSNDRATESSLIIDCTFGKEKYEFDTGEHKAGDFKEQCGIKHLFQMANNIIKWLIWLALVGAGALIFFKGAKLATNVFDKGGHQEARKGVQEALKKTLIGLIVILGAYLIVKAGFDIIGYNLNGGDPFKWDESALPAPDVSQLESKKAPETESDTQNQQTDETPPQTPAAEPQQNTQGETEIGQCAQKGGGTAQCACVNCKELNHPDITIKNNRKMHTDLVTKLSNLKNNTKDIEWVITEAWPTTSGHNANCHYVGTCVDIDFAKASPTDEEIERFIIVARSVGLRAVWETRDKERVETLRGRKDITNKNVENYSVPDHFSVYDCRLPSAPRKACS